MKNKKSIYSEPTPWIILNMGVVLIIILFTVHITQLRDQLDDQAPRLEHRDITCHSLKIAAITGSEDLRSADPTNRDWGFQQYKMLSSNGWQTANMCVPTHLALVARCDDDDLPCQLAALDWAAINIR